MKRKKITAIMAVIMMAAGLSACSRSNAKLEGKSGIVTWILGNVTRIPRHELPQTLDFSDFLPLFT